MAANEVDIRVRSTDDTKPGFDSAENRANKLSGAMGGIGKAAGLAIGGAAVAAVGGLVAVFKTGIDEQSDFLKGQAQLAAGVKSTGGVAGVTVDHMEDLASSIQNYSGQTDDSIVASEKLLLTFTNIRNKAGQNNDIFDQTVKVSADMAAKMGGDASDSAIQLGKALNDPVKGITALTRVGVSFTDQQKDQIAALVKSGDTLGAQKIILKELNTEFGGSAKAAGDTLPGQLARARRAFEDVSQSVLQALMPVLLKLADILTQYVLPAFSKGVAWVIANWPKIQKTIVSSYNSYIRPALMAIVGVFRDYVIPAVASAVGYVVSHWPQIQNAFALFWQTVRPVFEAFKNLLMTIWHSVMEPLIAWIRAHWTEISAVLQGIAIAIGISFKIMAVIITEVFNIIAAAIRIAVPIIVGIIQAVVDIVKIVIAIVKAWYDAWVFQINLIIAVVKTISGAVSGVYSDVQTIFGNIIGFVTGLPAKISAAASGMWDGIKHAFEGVINAVIRGWNSLQFSTPDVPGTSWGGQHFGVPPLNPVHLAHGGLATGIAAVGEHGTELVDFGARGGRVKSAADSNAARTTGGGVVQLEFVGGPAGGMDAFLWEWMKKNVRIKGGGNVQAALGAS